MRIVFFGTPKEGARILEELLDAKREIVGVVTQPDRPRGRGLSTENSPVKELSLKAGIPVFQPENLRDKSFEKTFSSLRPDIGVVVAYGRIIPAEILDVPGFGLINVHASLLPKYRGAAPIQWALINGESETGITIFKLKEALDSGEIVLQEKIRIDDDDNAGTLSKKLFELGGKLVIAAIDNIENGSAVFVLQDESKVSYAPKISREIGAIDWRKGAKEISWLVRALNPSPAAHTYYKKKLLRIFDVDYKFPDGEVRYKDPGTVIERVKNIGFAVLTGKGPMLIKEVQPESGKRMSAWDFLVGHRIQIGEILPS